MIPFARILEYGNTVVLPEKARITCSDYSTNWSLIYEGILYLTGSNANYQLSDAVTTDIYNTWIKVPETEKVRLCSTGYSQTVYITQSGKVMIVGNNVTSSGSPNVKKWTNITNVFSGIDTKKITYISIDRYGLMVILDDGSVWGVGTDNSGWSGQGSSTIGFFSFRKLYDEKKAMIVACGTAVSRIVLEDYTILSAGNNKQMQCNGSSDINVVTFTESFPGVDTSLINQIKLSNNNCLIYLADRTYYGTGWGSYGSLGNGNTSSGVNNFGFYSGVLPAVPRNLRNYFPHMCNGATSASVFLGEDGFLYATGYKNANLLSSTTDYGRFMKCIQSTTPYQNVILYIGSGNCILWDVNGNLTCAVSSQKNTAPIATNKVPTLGMGEITTMILPS